MSLKVSEGGNGALTFVVLFTPIPPLCYVTHEWPVATNAYI